MKPMLNLLLVIVATLTGMTGCTTYRAEEMARQDATTQYLQNELQTTKDRSLQLEADQSLLNQTIQQQSATIARQQQEIQQLQTLIEELKAGIASLNAARKTDRQEIIDQLTKTVVKLIQDSRPAAPPVTSGRVHVVEQGHTLSSIAVAFGVTVDAIKRTNNLKSDFIRVGQELIIPD